MSEERTLRLQIAAQLLPGRMRGDYDTDRLGSWVGAAVCSDVLAWADALIKREREMFGDGGELKSEEGDG